MKKEQMVAQTGQYHGREVRVRDALGASVTVPVEGQIDRHEPVRLWDNRISKTFQINDRHSIKAMFDLYNTLNSAAELRFET